MCITFGNTTMTHNLRLAFILLAALVCGAAQGASAKPMSAGPMGETVEPRIALVIGNAHYENAMKLANPANDAELIGSTLKKLGFDVILVTDAEQKKMQRAVIEFGDRLAKAGPEATGLFYYAGHGMQVEGENYLIPVDATIQREADVEIDAVPTTMVLKQMAFANSRVNIVILDACRDNPLASDFRSMGQSRGFAEIRSKPKGTFISYSTAPGEVAADGSDGHSPFAEALAAAMMQPGLDLPEVFQHVRERVLEETDQKQTPWDSSSLVKSFYFVPPQDTPAIANAIASAAPGASEPVNATPIEAAPAASSAAVASNATPAAPIFVAANHELYAKSGSRIRLAPDKNAGIVANLAINTPLRAVGRSTDGAWWKVATADGEIAYVHRLGVSDYRLGVVQPPLLQTAAVVTPQASVYRGISSPKTGIGVVDAAIHWLSSNSSGRTADSRAYSQTTRSQH